MLVLVILFLFCLTDIRFAFAAEVMSFDPTDPSGNGGSPVSLSSVDKEKEETDLPKLSTIILGQYSRVAVIDGQRVKETEQIGGYIVKTISRKEVVLLKSDKEIRLLLPDRFEGKIEDRLEQRTTNENFFVPEK